jgi:hypothetical protein
MPFYHLTLIASGYAVAVVGALECFVTAIDERAARAPAARCFTAAANGSSPWNDPSSVRCRPMRGLNRLPPPEGVVVVPDRVAFTGWRAFESASDEEAHWPADGRSWPVCD